MIVSKLSNNISWGFIGWILILSGLVFYVQGYKPIIFGIGILVIFYRAVTVHVDDYDPKINH
jgi:hypothetical protein